VVTPYEDTKSARVGVPFYAAAGNHPGVFAPPHSKREANHRRLRIIGAWLK